PSSTAIFCPATAQASLSLPIQVRDGGAACGVQSNDIGPHRDGIGNERDACAVAGQKIAVDGGRSDADELHAEIEVVPAAEAVHDCGCARAVGPEIVAFDRGSASADLHAGVVARDDVPSAGGAVADDNARSVVADHAETVGTAQTG